MSEHADDTKASEVQHRELTAKQAAFASLVANGAKYSDAYREAYNTKENASTKSVNVAASRLAKKPHVAKRIEELKGGDLSAKLNNDKLSQQWIMEKLRAEAVNPKNSASVRVRALELLGKNQQMFGDEPTVVINQRSPQEIEREIQKRLADFLELN